MALFLVEFNKGSSARAEHQAWLDGLAKAVGQAGGAVVEAQVAVDLEKTYVVVEAPSCEGVSKALAGAQPAPSDVAEVRLVGAKLDDVKGAKGGGGFLVEWDLPAGLTMDRYLTRKAEKTPLYAQVPEVKFLRTYVREDMGKCLCFYEAPDQQAVVRAREVVGAPINRLTRVEKGGQDAS